MTEPGKDGADVFRKWLEREEWFVYPEIDAALILGGVIPPGNAKDRKNAVALRDRIYAAVRGERLRAWHHVDTGAISVNWKDLKEWWRANNGELHSGLTPRKRRAKSDRDLERESLQNQVRETAISIHRESPRLDRSAIIGRVRGRLEKRGMELRVTNRTLAAWVKPCLPQLGRGQRRPSK